MRDYNGKQERVLGKARCRCCHRNFDLLRGLFICPFSGQKLILISFQSTDYIKGHSKGYEKSPEKSHGWIRLLMDSDLLGG